MTAPDSQNRPILNIASAMRESQDFRQDFSQAVDDSLPKTGRLHVTNTMGITQYLWINGSLRPIPPSGATFDVPAGTVTTELAGEAPKNWVIAAPSYEQGIIIAPRRAPVLMTSF